MAVYRFKFKKVLDYRKSIEDQKKDILSKSIKKYMDEKERLLKLYNDLDNSGHILQRQVRDGTTIEKIKQIYEKQKFYREGIKKKINDVNKAEEEVKRSRCELVKAMQNKKIMERLNEIKYNQFLIDEKCKFEKSIEEIITFKESKK